MELLPATRILAEIFPANVTINGAYTGDDYKVLLTDKAVVIIREGTKGPEPFLEAVWDSYSGSRRKELTVQADENTFLFSRSSNCGCGSRMRGYTPFRGIPFAPIQ